MSKLSKKNALSRPAAPAAETAAEPVVSLAAAERVLGLPVETARERHARLTRRERQVAALMADGQPNREIAAALEISPKTLDIHRANLMRKLEARTTASVANTINLVRLADAADA